MKPETQDWIEKAEGDWKVVQREMRAEDPVWGVVCFLAQQCAEKYLKAFLEENNIPFKRVHDLVILLEATKGLLPELEPLRERLAYLSVFGVAVRYPGVRADQFAAEDSMRTAKEVRIVIRGKLGLL